MTSEPSKSSTGLERGVRTFPCRRPGRARASRQRGGGGRSVEREPRPTVRWQGRSNVEAEGNLVNPEEARRDEQPAHRPIHSAHPLFTGGPRSFCGARRLPDEFRGETDACVDLVAGAMPHEVASRKLARSVVKRVVQRERLVRDA